MEDKALIEVTQSKALCQKLMETKHFAKMGEEGLFAVIQRAKSLNMNPLDAINGGLYYCQGRVEMSAQAMNAVIRQAGHSIQRDPKSNDKICILKGRRADNGDEWMESFSIEEAKTAGIFRAGGPWSKYPRDMLFARALSRLARQLFPDVTKGTYVIGEISEAPPLEEPVVEEVVECVSPEDVGQMECLLEGHDDVKAKVIEFIKKEKGKDLSDLPKKHFEKVMKRIVKLIEEKGEKDGTEHAAVA